MELQEFLRETQADVRSLVSEGSTPYAEIAFCDIVMQHMSEAGMTFEPVPCEFKRRVGNFSLRLSGYALSDEGDQLDLFVSLYEGVEVITSVPDTETLTAAMQCLKFLEMSADGRLQARLDPSDDVLSLAETLRGAYDELEQVRIFVLTDKVAKSKHFKTQELGGKAVRLEVMDIQRLHRHISEGKPRDELQVNFNEVSGGPLPCVFVPGIDVDYDYALTAMPGEALRLLYERFGARLLEANVRSFLSVKSKGVNAGIQSTLRIAPGRFMAYNNGIVIIADEMIFNTPGDSTTGIAYLRGLQIVNGGQTTASLYFSKRRHPETDLNNVRVAAKIIVMREPDPAKEEALISDISRYANSQNAVRQSDLSANKPFHVEIEKLAQEVYCPDGVGRWFYERASGSYNTFLMLKGNTPAQIKALKETIPPSRRLTKTDLAKFIMAWDLRPDFVSLGSQKNFDKFMLTLTPADGNSEPTLPSLSDYKVMIAKAKLYKDASKAIRPMFPSFQGNVTAYTMSLVSKQLGSRLDMDRIWMRQGASPQLLEQIGVWAKEVNSNLHKTSKGRMISEWAKKPECRDEVLDASYSAPAAGIPELKAG